MDMRKFINLVESTWHQDKAAKRDNTKLYHETKWTVVTDPPNSMRTMMLFSNEADAKKFLEKSPKHSYILPPGGHKSTVKESGFGEYVDHNPTEMMNNLSNMSQDNDDTGDQSMEVYRTFDNFTRGYFDAVMFTEAHSDNPELEHITIQDMALDTMINMKNDCEKFQTNASEMGISFDDVCNKNTSEYPAEELAGHDFWLTRNHHGAGFWDGDWEDEAGKKLTSLSHSFGEVWVYLGDDDKVHIH